MRAKRSHARVFSTHATMFGPSATSMSRHRRELTAYIYDIQNICTSIHIIYDIYLYANTENVFNFLNIAFLPSFFIS